MDHVGNGFLSICPFLSGQVPFSFALNLSESWKGGRLPSAAKGKGPWVHWFDPKPHPVPGGKAWSQRNPPPTYHIRSLAKGAGTERDSEKVFVGEKALSPLFDNGKQLWH